VLKDGSADELNLVGFANYILGSTDVSTSLRLQAVTAIGAALNNADAGDLVTGSLPVVVYRRGRYERWLPSPGALLRPAPVVCLRRRLATLWVSVDVRPAGRTVRVLTAPLGSWAAVYRAAFERELRGYGVRGVGVEMWACRTPAAVARALGAQAAGSPLGVVVALGQIDVRHRAGVAPRRRCWAPR